VLIVVIIGTSKIFSTASQITGIGAATTAVLRTGAVIERQMRDDLSRLCSEGFFVIHCVAVRNDVRDPGDPVAQLLDPAKPMDYVFRADQLMFFANGVQSMQSLRQGMSVNRDGQGSAARVLYSHAFQLRNALPVVMVGGDPNNVRAHDPNFTALTAAGDSYSWPLPMGQIPPWYPGMGQAPTVPMAGRIFQGAVSAAEYTIDNAGMPTSISGTQPPANEWILAREAIIMADDDAQAALNFSKLVMFNGAQRALYSIFPLPTAPTTMVRNGRVDAVAENLNDVRRAITLGPGVVAGVPVPAGWLTAPGSQSQRNRIMRAVYYPRAEARAPGMHRVDQALTNNALAIGCSSFRVDWTYHDGTGAALDANGNLIDPNGIPFDGDEFYGVRISSAMEKPWFGLTGSAASVYNYGDPSSPLLNAFTPATTINPNVIETSLTDPLPDPTPALANQGYADYWAVFGYNQTMPFLDTSIDPDGAGATFDGIPSRVYYGAASAPDGVPPAIPPFATNSQQIAYTPWPSAIRVTMTLTDPENKIEGGREFQFVIELPRRVP